MCTSFKMFYTVRIRVVAANTLYDNLLVFQFCPLFEVCTKNIARYVLSFIHQSGIMTFFINLASLNASYDKVSFS